jgi:hypothetical protein
MYLPCDIKTVVLTYTIYIIIRIQVHRDASIQVLSYISTLSHIAEQLKKVIEHKVGVFIFSTTSV